MCKNPTSEMFVGFFVLDLSIFKLESFFMSIEEIKIDVINKIIQLKSEDALKEIVLHLEQLDIKKNSTIDLSKNYDVIKSEFGNVLQKLAQ